MKKSFDYNNIWRAAITIMVIATFCIISYAGVRYYFLNVYSKRDLIDFSDGWISKEGKVLDLDEERFGGSKQKININKNIPKNTSPYQKLIFQSENVNIYIYCEGRLIYFYRPKTTAILGKSYGKTFHRVGIRSYEQGSDLTVVLEPIYDDESAAISHVYLGDSGDYNGDFITKNIGVFAATVVIILVSVMIFILAFYLSRNKTQRKSMIFLALMSLMIGMYLISDTGMVQLLTNGGAVLEVLKNFYLMYSVLACVGFVVDTYDGKYEWIFAIFSILTVILNLVLLISTSSGRADYHELFICVQIFMLIQNITCGILIVKETLLNKKNRRGTWFMPAGYLLITGSMAYSVIYYKFNLQGVVDSRQVVAVNNLIFLFIMLFHYFGEVLGNVQRAAEANTLQKVAYTDELTGLYNRTAFYKKEKEYTRLVESGQSKGYLIVFMDLNNLKKVNDIHGHDAGDQFLIAASGIIKRSFGKKGDSFRTGGDEFIAAIPFENLGEGSVEKNKAELLQEFLKEEELEIQKYSWGSYISIAYGFATYRGLEGETIYEVEKLADKNMYTRKSQMKAEGKVTVDLSSNRRVN